MEWCSVPQLVELFASSFHKIPGKFELAVRLTRIMFPFLLVVALAAQAMGVLNACKQFGVPALSSVWFNVGSVAFGLVIGAVAGACASGISRIEGMAYGVVFGGVLQLLFQVPSLIRVGVSLLARNSVGDHPGFRNVLRLMGPAILGQCFRADQCAGELELRDRPDGCFGPCHEWPSELAGLCVSGSCNCRLGLFGVAIATASLPAISRSAAPRRICPEFRETSLARACIGDAA